MNRTSNPDHAEEHRGELLLSEGGPGGGAILSLDELSYLRAVFSACAPEGRDPVEIGLISAIGHEWPLRLLNEMDNLALYAEHGTYRFVFPLELDGRAHDLRLSMHVPRIFDIRGKSRSWRAAVRNGEVHVAESSGKLTGLRAIDISTSGISICAEDGAMPYEDRDIQLLIALPNSNEPIALRGLVVRRIEGPSPVLGVQFTRVSLEQEDALSAYLLRVHTTESLQNGSK